MTIKSKVSDRPNTDEGLHPARIVRIVEYGIQTRSNFNTGEDEEVHQLRITFELPEVMHEFKEGEGKKPAWETPFPYNISFNGRSKLSKHFKQIVGKEWGTSYDLGLLINTPVMVNIEHTIKDGTTYANIKDVVPAPKGTKVGKLQNDPLVYSIDEDGFEGAKWESLRDFERDAIMESQEFFAFEESVESK